MIFDAILLIDDFVFLFLPWHISQFIALYFDAKYIGSLDPSSIQLKPVLSKTKTFAAIMSNCFKPLSIEEKRNKYKEFEIWKVAFLYELSNEDKKDLVCGYIRKWNLNSNDYDEFIRIFIKFIDDGLIYQFSGKKQFVKWLIEQHNIWDNSIIKGIYIYIYISFAFHK